MWNKLGDIMGEKSLWRYMQHKVFNYQIVVYNDKRVSTGHNKQE